MKKIFFLGLIALIMFIVMPIKRSRVRLTKTEDNALQITKPPLSYRSGAAKVLLNECEEEFLGIRFLCDYAWKDLVHAQNEVYYEISAEPLVLFKIVKFDLDILYIHQLDRDKLASLGRYSEGFRIEEVTIAGFKAMKVKAFSIEDAQARITDYYFVRKGILYALLFSVDPKEKWDDYKFIFHKIAQSFEFYSAEKNNVVK